MAERVPVYELGANFVEDYHPRLIGHGGEHVVFSLEGRPNIVAKVDLSSIDRLYRKSLSGENPLKGYQHRAKAYLEEKRRLRMALKQAFGAEHVLGQKTFFAKVPFTPEMRYELSHLQDQAAGIAPAFVWGLVEIQKRSRLIGQAGTESVTGGYAEWAADTVPMESYAAATQALLNGEDIPKTQLRDVQGRHMLGLLGKLDHSKEWRDGTAEFVEGAITFTQGLAETCIDLAGGENVVIGRPGPGQRLTYELVDPLPTTTLTLPMVQDAWRKCLSRQPMTAQERNRLLNGMNYLRTINGLASYIGLAKRIKFLSEGVSIDVSQGKDLVNLYHAS